MKYFFTISLIVLLTLSADGLKAQTEKSGMTPIEFNDNLTSITDSLFARGQQWGLQFNEAYKTKTFSGIRPYRESMERFINTSIARVKAMGDVKGSKDLRMAMINFLEFEKRMVTEGFKPMDELSTSAGMDDVKAVYSKIKTFSDVENSELAKVAVAQEAYGKANGFKIESAEKAVKDKP